MGDEWKTAFEECEYDAIVLGTGMKECLISGLLSVEGKKVLHLDRNPYYGGDAASVQIKQAYQKFKPGSEPDEAVLGKLRDYNIDLVPKYIMASGNLVKVLIHTGTADYMEYKPVDGSFCYRPGSGGPDQQVHQVPINAKAAMSSPLMSTMEKTRAVQFFSWVNDYEVDNPKTHKAGMISKTTLDLKTMTCQAFFKYWNLADTTIDFVIHSIALFRDDSVLQRPALELVEKMQLYVRSLLRFPNMTSPYIYPLYGLGELPQAFARLAAVHGGLYMLNHEGHLNNVEIEYDGTTAVGVKAEGVVAKAKLVVADPSYVPSKVKAVGKVVRFIAIMNHALVGSNGSPSCQVIFPGNYIGRKNDVYMFCISGSHKVAAADHWVAFASTTVEGPTEGLTAQQIAERELKTAFPLASPAQEIFYDMYDEFEPIDDGVADRLVISKTYDATSHFETAITDVMDMYKRCMGKDLVLTSGPKRE
jgi:Rab GDP dissociation inhibitor